MLSNVHSSNASSEPAVLRAQRSAWLCLGSPLSSRCCKAARSCLRPGVREHCSVQLSCTAACSRAAELEIGSVSSCVPAAVSQADSRAHHRTSRRTTLPVSPQPGVPHPVHARLARSRPRPWPGYWPGSPARTGSRTCRPHTASGPLTLPSDTTSRHHDLCAHAQPLPRARATRAWRGRDGAALARARGAA